eukprot:NODE_498_length_6794_cov_0.318250.p6 type:complete len:161 gc:universal NODE_498_length_6794_cov_0.318250:6018-6500(+)
MLFTTLLLAIAAPVTVDNGIDEAESLRFVEKDTYVATRLDIRLDDGTGKRAPYAGYVVKHYDGFKATLYGQEYVFENAADIVTEILNIQHQKETHFKFETNAYCEIDEDSEDDQESKLKYKHKITLITGRVSPNNKEEVAYRLDQNLNQFFKNQICEAAQ